MAHALLSSLLLRGRCSRGEGRGQKRPSRRTPTLLVKIGRLFQFRIPHEIMLDPKLRAGSGEECFNAGTRSDGLGCVEFRGRDAAELSLFRVVVQIAAEQNRPGLSKFQE